ncbi:MAG: hypothetical protein NW202_09580 [Nitrospira sp.]|nr:hypothetical protein [Nitrospira sp.]
MQGRLSSRLDQRAQGYSVEAPRDRSVSLPEEGVDLSFWSLRSAPYQVLSVAHQIQDLIQRHQLRRFHEGDSFGLRHAGAKV